MGFYIVFITQRLQRCLSGSGMQTIAIVMAKVLKGKGITIGISLLQEDPSDRLTKELSLCFAERALNVPHFYSDGRRNAAISFFQKSTGVLLDGDG
ncbi:hypothetical protein AVEN_157903-1 [Araneus ventricosus]|uniref:Uncharacterized protein n=1 Tax=Araneus ventricosus TaxID=182803 RepID=A0A4Y2FK79_ARAVE|nr:hypothetical protein AVEN_157903-1 [Araneus ventricosus]